MYKRKENEIPNALYHAVLGKMVLDHVERIHPTVISQAMENRAVQMLEAIRCVLENDKLNDEDCCQRIDNLIRLFFEELAVQINRHNELD